MCGALGYLYLLYCLTHQVLNFGTAQVDMTGSVKNSTGRNAQVNLRLTLSIYNRNSAVFQAAS